MADRDAKPETRFAVGEMVHFRFLPGGELVQVPAPDPDEPGHRMVVTAVDRERGVITLAAAGGS